MHKIKKGIYNGYIVINNEYDPRLYYYVVYYKDFIINKIRSDLKLPNDYKWVPIE